MDETDNEDKGIGKLATQQQAVGASTGGFDEGLLKGAMSQGLK